MLGPINEQFLDARKAFPNLIQLSPFEFQISFPTNPNAVYRITLTQFFPESPPILSVNGQPMVLPIIEKWVSFFRLFHVVDNLQKYLSFPSVQQFSFRNEEITEAVNSSSPQDLQTEQGRLSIIRSLPTYQEAVKYADAIQQEGSKTEPFLNQKRNEFYSDVQYLFTLKEKYYNLLNQKNALSSKNAKIDQLKAEESILDQQISQLDNQFQNDQIDLSKYLGELKVLKKKKYIAHFIIEGLK